eukprot:14821915-Alexandrium_andersonii.AAC.1
MVGSERNDIASATDSDRAGWLGARSSTFFSCWAALWQVNDTARPQDRVEPCLEMVSTMDEVSRQFWRWAAGMSCVKVRARE